MALSALIDQRFDDLQHLATQQERELAAEAEKIWDKSEADIQAAKAVPSGRATDDRLGPFHDHIDEAASILAELRESERRFRAPVHHASDVFTVIGADAEELAALLQEANTGEVPVAARLARLQ